MDPGLCRLRGRVAWMPWLPPIVWLRDDLRLDDNPALAAAAALPAGDRGVHPRRGLPRHPSAGRRSPLVAPPLPGRPRRRPRSARVTAAAPPGRRRRRSSGTWPSETGAGQLVLEPALRPAGADHGRRHQGMGRRAGHRSHQLPGEPALRAVDGPHRHRRPVQGLHAVLACLPGRRANHGCPPMPRTHLPAARRRHVRFACRPVTGWTAGGCSPASRTGAAASPKPGRPGEDGAARPAGGFPGRARGGVRHRAGTCPASRAPAGSPRTSASARSARSASGMRSGNASRARRRPTSGSSGPSLAGVSSAGSCSTRIRSWPRDNYRPEFDRLCLANAVGRRTGGLAAGAHRLSAGGRRDAAAVADRLDAQPGPDGRGVVPGQEHAGRLARWARHGSGTPWWTPTPRATRPTGSGWPAQARTRRPTSGSSTR